MDLFVINRTRGSIFGADDAFFCAPRIDDLQCAYGTLVGFLLSGTIVNNEWQALTDSIQQLSKGVMRLLQKPATDSAGQVNHVHAIDSLHRRMSSCIQYTAQRNRDNALGRYIHDHYQAPAFQ